MDEVWIKNGHLVVTATLADRIFGAATRVDWVYYPSNYQLLAAPYGDEIFRQLHKTKTSMLKLKNGVGDRSWSIQELLLDEPIDPRDRAVSWRTEEEVKLLSVQLGGTHKN